jgi:hypothetical protein
MVLNILWLNHVTCFDRGDLKKRRAKQSRDVLTKFDQNLGTINCGLRVPYQNRNSRIRRRPLHRILEEDPVKIRFAMRLTCKLISRRRIWRISEKKAEVAGLGRTILHSNIVKLINDSLAVCPIDGVPSLAYSSFLASLRPSIKAYIYYYHYRHS